MRAVFLLFASVLIFAAPLAPAQAQQAKNTVAARIVCESRGGPSFCPADTRRGVQLVRDLSGRCQIGRGWGYDARGIWVDRGCTGEFDIGSYGNNQGWGWGFNDGRVIVCASENYQRSFCSIGRTELGVRLVNQISNAPCVRGRTWWRDARGIVVTEGCAGEFEVGYREDAYETPPADAGGGYYRPGTVRCASSDFKRRYCQADISYGAASLVRQLSDTRCVYGQNWSYDRRGIWVQDGCAGEFEIGYSDERPPFPGGGGSAVSVRCESRDYRQNTCDLRGAREARLTRQVSKAPCVEGRTWGFDRGRVWVTEGCGGYFEGY